MNIFFKIESNLKYSYQKEILKKIIEGYDLDDEDCLDNLYRLIYNLFLDDTIDNLALISILNVFDLTKINRNDAVKWPFYLNILLLKIIIIESNIEKQYILDFIINNNESANKMLINKRFDKILNGNLVDLAEKKFNSTNVSDVNLRYAWGVSLLTKQLQQNIYQYNENLDDFKININTERTITILKSYLDKIDNLEGK